MRDVAKAVKKHLKESYNPDFNNIPIESMLENPEIYNGVPVYSRYRYFGDCRNTVYVDHMWDATEMSNWISTKCKIIDPELVLDKITDGDRKIPKKALKIIDKLSRENKLENLSDIVCALDDYQKIMFIYLPETDIHYFFDCVK